MKVDYVKVRKETNIENLTDSNRTDQLINDILYNQILDNIFLDIQPTFDPENINRNNDILNIESK